MIVTLIGYRGTGKSTVGRQLAARLGWDCYDSDSLIEARTGTSIAKMFTENGEPYFRQIERSVLDDLLQQSQIVISAGGGAILDQITRQQMREAGPVVWLQASAETIFERISSDPGSDETRPALTDSTPMDEIMIKLQERDQLYSSTATLTVETDRRDITSIVNEIVSKLPIDEI